MARKKLIFAHNWNHAQNNKMRSSLSIMASRTTLLNQFNIQDSTLNSDLIARYMATLYKYDDETGNLSMFYVNEPILSDSAAFYMSNIENLVQIIGEINSILSTNAFHSPGSIGEFVTEIILLAARDKAITQNFDNNENIDYMEKYSYSGPVTVRQFLNALIGSKNLENLEENDENRFSKQIKKNRFSKRLLDDGIITFTHFIQKLDVLNLETLIMSLIGSCCAVRLCPNFPIFDYIGPIIFKDNSIGCFAIQTKNRIDINTTQITRKMNFKSIFTQDNYKQTMNTKTDIEFQEKDCLKILFSLAEKEKKPVIRNGTLIISGLTSKNCPCLESNDDQLIMNLKKLINYNRNPFNDMKEKEDRKRYSMVRENTSSQ
jgi:hypothetical protein